MRKKGHTTRLLKVFALLAALTAVAQAEAGPSWGPETPKFNLEAVLRPDAGGPDSGFGLVKFRQPNDADTTVHLDLWVRGLAPNNSYYLQRATDSSVNDDCTGTNWLTLGHGSTAVAITTDDKGTGRGALFRNLPVAPGTQLDIHFRVIDAVSSVVVLQSGCYQFTVSR